MLSKVASIVGIATMVLSPLTISLASPAAAGVTSAVVAPKPQSVPTYNVVTLNKTPVGKPYDTKIIKFYALEGQWIDLRIIRRSGFEPFAPGYLERTDLGMFNVSWTANNPRQWNKKFETKPDWVHWNGNHLFLEKELNLGDLSTYTGYHYVRVSGTQGRISVKTTPSPVTKLLGNKANPTSFTVNSKNKVFYGRYYVGKAEDQSNLWRTTNITLVQPKTSDKIFKLWQYYGPTRDVVKPSTWQYPEGTGIGSITQSSDSGWHMIKFTGPDGTYKASSFIVQNLPS